MQVETVVGLSILELFLLVALFRLQRKGMESANFEMAFGEYSSLRRGGSYRGVDETAPKPSAFRAFERLLSASLIAYCDSRSHFRWALYSTLCVAISYSHSLSMFSRNYLTFASQWYCFWMHTRRVSLTINVATQGAEQGWPP